MKHKEPYWSTKPNTLEQDIINKKIINLYLKGYSYRQIQSFTDVPYSKSYICNLIKKYKNK